MKINKDFINILLKQLFISFGILLLVHIGVHFPVPGIDHINLALYFQKYPTSKILNLKKNPFIIGLFTVNIGPYVNASLLTELILKMSPQLSKLKKEDEFEGRRKINRVTRFITLILAILQSSKLVFDLKSVLFNWNYFLAIKIIIWLTTGAMIVLWLSELITDYGLGNGASLIIYTNVVSNLADNVNEIKNEINKNFSTISIIKICILFYVLFYGIIFLQEGYTKVPLVSSKQLNHKLKYTSSIINNYLPLRFNQAGIMPLLLTETILTIPNYITNLNLLSKINFLINFNNLKFIYWIKYCFLIIIFNFFYSTLILSPNDISDKLKTMAVIINGVRSGDETTFYLKHLMEQISFIGAIIFIFLTILLNFLKLKLNLISFKELNITSLMIIIGAILDLLREIRNIYYSNFYNDIY